MRVHAGIAKPLEPAAFVDLDDGHLAVEMPAQHRVGAIIRRRDPGRAGRSQLLARARRDLFIAGLAADGIGPADQIPGRRDVIEEHADHEGDAGDDSHPRPPECRFHDPVRPALARQHHEIDGGRGESRRATGTSARCRRRAASATSRGNRGTAPAPRSTAGSRPARGCDSRARPSASRRTAPPAAARSRRDRIEAR